MKPTKNYFFQSFAIVVISIAALIGFKQVLPSKIFTETATATKNVVVDSLMLEAVQEEAVKQKDSVAPEEKIVKEDKQKVFFQPEEGIAFPPETYSNYKGFQYLMPFYQKLVQLEKSGEGNVRIAYFGDSMTDGDLIVKDLRAALQARFGGQGVGFVNITSESAASRSTLTHQFSNNWKTQSYLNVKHPEKPFGVSGYVFFTKHDTLNPVWVKYKSVKFNNISQLNDPVLFYGHSENTTASVHYITGNDTVIKKLNPVNRLNTLRLGNSATSFRAEFFAADSIPLYGFNFDDGRGVHVDNFSNRGNSGLPISILNKPLMKAFNEKLGYDLIILHYGTNVLNYGTYDYYWYEKKMGVVVNHLKECFPGVSILIISTADKSTKYGTEMQTDSAVVPLTRAQKRYALNNKAGYINLYMLMGGNGSMVKWADTIPALANKDYTHFNYRGAKKVAGIIYNELNKGYEDYKKLGGDKVVVKLPKDTIRKNGLPKDTVRKKGVNKDTLHKNIPYNPPKKDSLHANTN
ncbi:SGNH/GDSL hydrolase family protein [Flavobacterium rhizosphaerae]|uniref:GDSL-like Lipase/Acylhydrolase family protein n=1 Tax=Flavobacterium rhizosphaerae TaxID=3163298 RepID=A0ABW8YY06_9FLAO